MFFISFRPVTSITVPALEDVHSVAELLAPIGRNGGRYLEPGSSASRSLLTRTGLMTAGAYCFCGRNRLERRRSIGFADICASKIERDDSYRGNKAEGLQGIMIRGCLANVTGRRPMRASVSIWQPRYLRFPLRPVALRPLLSKGVPLSNVRESLHRAIQRVNCHGSTDRGAFQISALWCSPCCIAYNYVD